MSKVTDLLGSQYPIIQGAMGVICNPELVAAVSEAGGFGLLATAFAEDVEAVREQAKVTKKLTNKPFGANLFMMNPLTENFAKVLAEEGIRTVTVSGGSPKALIPLLRDLGLKVIVVVPTVEVAKGAEGLGADAVVAEGSESGGHGMAIENIRERLQLAFGSRANLLTNQDADQFYRPPT